VVSENGIVIDVDNELILAQKGAKERISPASMTKILTVLVAAEHISDLTDTFEITYDIENYSYVNDCSNVGFSVGEVVTVEDLFYGTILPSGADAALGLAIYTAGSEEAFVELMNEKIAELGISETTHFTNCIGLYNDNHYSTVYDMAVILKAAYDNSFCREVLSARTYTTSATDEHPDGITISNWFLRRIEDKETNGEVLCAKTGFVVQSGNCAASLSVGADGKVYICVTAHSSSSWRCIYDHVSLYQNFILA
jgi:D-alanyl-D-alanine carboxypeptidase (penicillin-binding protein 5/6)